jgi:uncharacterized membrane protein YdbT with pleckstrin-like domain
MISRISDYLHPDESVIILARRHPATLIAPIILVVAGLTASLLYTASSNNNSIIVILIWSAFGLLVMNLIYKIVGWWAACFVVSSERMLLITGVVTRLSDSLDLNKVKDIGFERSVIGRLLGYGSFVFRSASDNQKLRLNYISPRAFERIATEIPSNAQQADAERGGDHAAVEKDLPTSVDEDSDRLRRRKSIVLIVIWIAALVAAVVVAKIPRIGTLANSELPIIAVALAATGPYVGGSSRWNSGR